MMNELRKSGPKIKRNRESITCDSIARRQRNHCKETVPNTNQRVAIAGKTQSETLPPPIRVLFFDSSMFALQLIREFVAVRCLASLLSSVV